MALLTIINTALIIVTLGYAVQIFEKGKILMALLDSVAKLRAAVTDLAERIAGISPDRVRELEETLARERQAAADLAAAEDAEDVEQNAALEEARAETDAKLAEISDASAGISEVTESIKGLAQSAETEEPTDPETPVDPVDPEEPEAPVDPEPTEPEAPVDPEEV